MAASTALRVDTVFPKQPLRQWALSVPYPLHFLFASRPGHGPCAGQPLSLYRRVPDQEGPDQEGAFSRKGTQIGAVARIQRFGRALNLDVRVPML